MPPLSGHETGASEPKLDFRESVSSPIDGNYKTESTVADAEGSAATSPVKHEEKLFEVDLTKPLVFQVGHLGPRYDEWVHKGIVSKKGPRLFASDFLEVFSNTYWWIIPLLWLPVMAYVEKVAVGEGVAIERIPLYMAGGVLLWTFLEYILHRFIFHSKTTTYWWNTAHYLLHGHHHKFPQDPFRLVFPPALNLIVTAPIITPFYYLLPFGVLMAMYGGALLGYVIYDVTHYWLHHGVSTRYPVAYRLRRYHLGHHFKHHNSGFGITSDLWDRIIGTRPPQFVKQAAAAQGNQ